MEVPGKRSNLSQDMHTDVLCEPCKVDDEDNQAELYCTGCNEFLCGNCASYHRRSKATRGHELLSGDDMPRRKLASIQDMYCQIHEAKPLEYFCEIHYNFFCSACLPSEHRQCVVKHTDELTTSFKTSEEDKATLSQIANLDRQLDETKKKTQTVSDAVNACFENVLTDIKKFRGRIQSLLDAMETDVINEARRIQTEDLTYLESIRKQCEFVQAELKEMKSNLETLRRYRQDTQLMISTKKAQTQTQGHMAQMKTMADSIHYRQFYFSRNEDLIKTLHPTRKLGTLEYRNDCARKVKNIQHPPERTDLKEVPASTTLGKMMMKMLVE